ncbi:GEVED domain-containing protein [Hymenobacter glacialis]|uniref:GEVED domain-containing protein n=1 Tax=Hymenobacter glacialis TaxID=1908236 RepID=UPI0009F680E8|nr:GEVED domain-containing protein [Hymenobacter glacialis]
MAPFLRFWSRFAPGVVAVLLAAGGAPAQAQTGSCPVPAACTPGRASDAQAAAFNMGILNVTLGNNLINRTSVGQAEGYQDLSCSTNAALVVGQSYAISIRTGANSPENVRVWIDYNNDGQFTGTTELAFSSNNATLHTGSIVPPGTATVGVRLRMRVAADFSNGTIPTPCSTPQYSQTEDYSVTLAANSSAPTAAFTTNGTTTCTGCVQFTDTSQNLPTAWLWTFGDGTTSTAQNPSHCYAAAGTYAVTLRATNAAGTSTSAATSILYNGAVPKAASCSPQTVNYFANYGITRVRLNTIDNTSADGSAGYEDFTCLQRTELIVGAAYPVTITTGGVNPHDIRLFLDSNNDGVLTAAEQVFQRLNTPPPGATFSLSLPANTVLNQPLRLRVVADAVGNNPGPCTSPANGQVEDYTVVALANTRPPIADFTSNYSPGNCVNPVQFTDASQNLPTSWLWNFGDGTTSTVQNPTHTYAGAGSYTVSLTATNAFGTNATSRPDAVVITVPCLTYCASNGTGGIGPGGTALPSPLFTTSVQVANALPAFVNNTANAPGGYADFTGSPIIVNSGSVLSLVVVTNLSISHRVAVWIDFDLNGVFDSSELVATGVTPNNTNTYTASIALPARTSALNTRMRILSVANANTPSPCSVNLLNAEVEDYQLRVQPLAARAAQALPALGIFPNPTADGRVRLRLPDARAAGPYATEVKDVLGATVLRTSLRLGPAADAELDLSALPPGVYVLHLRDAQGQTAVRRIVRE